MKYYITSIVLFISFQNIFGQTMKHENHYPRIEIYSEKDYAPENTGSDHTTDPSGRRVYMGKRVYKPFINRVSYLISEEQVAKLMNDSLNFLPYFKEQKPASTLGRYFELDKAKYLPEFKQQFPRSIDAYTSYPDDNRLYFSSIIEYQKTHPRSIEVVWLNATQWYINDVFYTIDLDVFKLEENKIIDEQLVEGNLQDFIRFSPIIQPKLSEEMRHLRIPAEQSEITKDEIILIISKSPGGPGSSSFVYTIEGNGKLFDNEGYDSMKISHYKVVEILTKISKIDFEGFSMNEKPQPFVHDGQTITIKAWSNGSLRTVSYGSGGEPMPSIIYQFMDSMLKICFDERK